MEKVIKRSKAILIFSVVVYVVYLGALYYAGGTIANYIWGAVAVIGFSLLGMLGTTAIANATHQEMTFAQSVKTYYKAMWKVILLNWILVIALLLIIMALSGLGK